MTARFVVNFRRSWKSSTKNVAGTHVIISVDVVHVMLVLSDFVLRNVIGRIRMGNGGLTSTAGELAVITHYRA